MANTHDARNTPFEACYLLTKNEDAKISIHDVWVKSFPGIPDLEFIRIIGKTVKGSDLVIVLTIHISRLIVA